MGDHLTLVALLSLSTGMTGIYRMVEIMSRWEQRHRLTCVTKAAEASASPWSVRWCCSRIASCAACSPTDFCTECKREANNNERQTTKKVHLAGSQFGLQVSDCELHCVALLSVLSAVVKAMLIVLLHCVIIVKPQWRILLNTTTRAMKKKPLCLQTLCKNLLDSCDQRS